MFNILSPLTSLASSDDGVTLEGSNVACPSLDKEASSLETGPRYLYYRIYTKSGAIASKNPIYPNDQSLSRIFTKSVAPPHTLDSLKRRLCEVEGFPENAQSCSLFMLLSNQKAMDEAASISLFGPSGPGPSEHDPMALVIGSDKWLPTVKPSKHPNFSRKPKYVYYRLYSTNGEIPSHVKFTETDTSLGRVETLAIAPPHTVASLKACLIKLELLATSPSQIFAVANNIAPMRDDEPLQFLTGTYPGRSGDVPMAFVVDTTLKLVKARGNYDYSAYHPSWLSIVEGEILTTNGIKRAQREPFGQPYQGYDVINSSGKRGFVDDAQVKFCRDVEEAWFPNVPATIFLVFLAYVLFWAWQ